MDKRKSVVTNPELSRVLSMLRDVGDTEGHMAVRALMQAYEDRLLDVRGFEARAGHVVE